MRIGQQVQQPGVKTVGIKSTQQQATLTLHRQRELLMKTRTMQTNSLRGLLYEFGVTFAQGYKGRCCKTPGARPKAHARRQRTPLG